MLVRAWAWDSNGRGAEGAAPPFAWTPPAVMGARPTLRARWPAPRGRVGSRGYPRERRTAAVTVAPGGTRIATVVRMYASYGHVSGHVLTLGW